MRIICRNFVNMNLKDLGANIASVRRSLGLTQENVAFDLNISSTSYAKIERGETNVSFMRLVQIADYFQVDIMEFISRNSADNAMQKDIADIKNTVDNIYKILTEQSETKK